MRKFLELKHAGSCLNRAKDEEWLFILLARDAVAPATIRFWAAERIRLGKNSSDDEQIVEALHCASNMEEQRELGKLKP